MRVRRIWSSWAYCGLRAAFHAGRIAKPRWGLHVGPQTHEHAGALCDAKFCLDSKSACTQNRARRATGNDDLRVQVCDLSRRAPPARFESAGPRLGMRTELFFYYLFLIFVLHRHAAFEFSCRAVDKQMGERYRSSNK